MSKLNLNYSFQIGDVCHGKTHLKNGFRSFLNWFNRIWFLHILFSKSKKKNRRNCRMVGANRILFTNIFFVTYARSEYIRNRNVTWNEYFLIWAFKPENFIIIILLNELSTIWHIGFDWLISYANNTKLFHWKFFCRIDKV